MCFPQRFFVMILVCIYVLTFFCQTSSPGAIQHSLIEDMNLTSSQYSGFYSVSSWASLLDVVNGYFIEKWLGLKLASIIYITVIIISDVLYITSVFIDSFWLLALGRMIFGLGGNPLILCINCFVLHWFEGKEVNFMFATMVSVVWLGSAFIFFISVRILNFVRSFVWIKEHMALAITISSLTVFLTLAMCLSGGIIALLYKEKDKPKVVGSQETVEQKKKEDKEKKTLKSLLNFHPIFWIFAVSAFFYFIPIISFIAMSQVFFKTIYHVSVEEASNLTSLFTILASVLSPALGYLVDRVGRNLIFYTLGVCCGIVAHGLFTFTSINPVVPVVILSISAALSSSSWSMFQYLVADHQYVMAYGIAQTGCNGAIAVGSLVAGYIVDIYGYGTLELFYFITMACTLPLIIIIWVLDTFVDNAITISTTERRERKEFADKKIAENIEPNNVN